MRWRWFVWRFFVTLGAFFSSLFVVNYVIDPFGYNGTNLVEFDRRVFSNSDRIAYKASRFRHTDARTAVFGDSTANMIDPEMVAPDLAASVFNFGIAGQTLFDMIDTVRYATDRKRFAAVYIGVPFRRFDDSDNAKNFRESTEAQNNAFVANTNYQTTLASLKGVLYLTGILKVHHRPADAAVTNKEWNRRLANFRAQLSARRDPVKLRKDVHDMVCALRSRGTTYVLVEFPIQETERAYVLRHNAPEYAAYKSWLSSQGTVLDYDIDNGMGSHRDWYHDASHLKPKYGAVLLRDMLSGQPKFAHVTKAVPKCTASAGGPTP